MRVARSDISHPSPMAFQAKKWIIYRRDSRDGVYYLHRILTTPPKEINKSNELLICSYYIEPIFRTSN